MKRNNLLGNRSLLVIGAAESVSGVGNWITTLAVYAMVVFRGDGSVAKTSGILLAGLLPTLLFSPVAGWLCDRFDRRKLMIVSELLAGLSVVGLVFAQRLELIYGLLVLQATFTSVMTPARQAVVPELVDQEDLTRANALLQQLAGIVKVGAPMLAGAILAVFDPHHAIILDAVSYIASAVLLSLLPALQPTEGERNKAAPGVEETSTSVMQVLRESAGLRSLFVAMFLAIFVIIGFDVLAPVFTRDILGGDESTFGFLIGLLGAGAVVATVLLMVRKAQRNLWRDVVVGLLLLAIIPGTQALLGNAGGLNDQGIVRTLFFVACFVGGIGNGLLIVQVSTLLQVLAPAGMLGRLGGAFQSIMVAGQLLGLFVTPLIVPGVMRIEDYLTVMMVALMLVAGVAGLSAKSQGSALVTTVSASTVQDTVQ